MPSRSHSKSGKGKAKLRRGRAYRAQRSSARRGGGTFTSEDSLMSKELSVAEEKKSKQSNKPVKGDDVFVSKALRMMMVAQKPKPTVDGVEKKPLGSKKRIAMEQKEKKDKEKQEKDERLTKVLEMKHTPQVAAAIKETHDQVSHLTKKKQKVKLYFKMKREKASMKKLKTQLIQATALERSKHKRKPVVEENSNKRDDDDDDDDVLEEEDLLDIDSDDEAQEDAYGEVEFGEQAQEPPKELSKLSSKLEKRIQQQKESRGKMSTKELLQERQNEILRKRVIENYNKNRQARIEKSEKQRNQNKVMY
ncbi:laminin-like protein [Acrasis kona]|uniref:Laminin-like protein n=1 Tax=Acrasis kona TaxID=1008807 RepID=A0AAW2YUE6_9EUKA